MATVIRTLELRGFPCRICESSHVSPMNLVSAIGNVEISLFIRVVTKQQRAGAPATTSFGEAPRCPPGSASRRGCTVASFLVLQS